MKKTISISTVFILLFFIGLAQPDSTKPAISLPSSKTSNDTKAKLFSPFSGGALSNFYSNISLSSFYKEGVNGKIELQGNFGQKMSGGISIDQKISSTDIRATPLSLSGISPGTTVEFNLQRIFWNPSFKLTASQEKELKEVEEAYAKRDSIDVRTVSLLKMSKNGTDKEKEIALAAINHISFSNPIFLNIKYGFTKTSFAYTTDSFTLVQNSDAFITPTVTVSLVKALSKGFSVNGYVSLSYKYSEYYTAADDVTFNVPFGTTRNTYSTTLAFGNPTKTTSNSIIGEYRKNISIKNPNGNPFNFGISPSATWDITNKLLGVFLPVYFIHGSDDNGKPLSALQGGVRLGYITSTEGQINSFKNGFTAQIIISTPLDFLKKL